jgi:Fe-S cluster assembly protein SufD
MSDTLRHIVSEAGRVGNLRGDDPEWLTNRRRAALDRFMALGFPTTRDEEWRFTSIAPIAEVPFALASNGAKSVDAADLAPYRLSGRQAATLVFVNGRYAPALSATQQPGVLPAGVRVDTLASAWGSSSTLLAGRMGRVAAADRQAFTALNSAFLSDGALIAIPDGAIVSEPIHIVFVSVPEGGPTMAHPRVLVLMGAGSQAAIVERYVARDHIAEGQWLTNAVTEIVAAQNAVLDYYRLQQEAVGSYHIGATCAAVARDATVRCHSVTFGGAIVRNDVTATLEGEGAECTLNGLYVADGARLVDNHTTIDHAKPHCNSREVYKGILADKARGVFNGKIVVRPDAQKTDAKQTNKALLLSENAQINTKPQLEIFANDVKCTHGAAVGQMDEEAMFYLRARGLDSHEARQLLIRAFAGDVISQMPLEAVRTHVDEELTRRLPRWRA